MKKRSRIFGFSLALPMALLLLAGCLFSGPDYTPTRPGADFTFEFPDMMGGIGETQEEMLDNWHNRYIARGFQPTLTDVSISLENGNVIISGVLDYGEGATAFETYGTLYAFGTMSGTEILGDINRVGNIHFARFLMIDFIFEDDIDTYLAIILQRVDNHHVMQFFLPITDELFDTFNSSVRSENQFTHDDILDDIYLGDGELFEKHNILLLWNFLWYKDYYFEEDW